MDKILYHGELFELPFLEKNEEGVVPYACPSKKDLILSIIRNKDVVGVLVRLPRLSEEYRRFFQSLHEHFRLLRIGIILDEESASENLGVKIFLSHERLHPLNDAVKSYFLEDKPRNRRIHNRYEWLLNGYLNCNGGEVRYEIHSFSAGGAFLRSDEASPKPGTRCSLRILFKNFQMISDCEVLDSRSASSRLPFGFSVKFVNISEEARAIADNIVNDALFRILTDIDGEPEIPSLDQEYLSSGFEPIL